MRGSKEMDTGGVCHVCVGMAIDQHAQCEVIEREYDVVILNL